jgi:triphosphatase
MPLPILGSALTMAPDSTPFDPPADIAETPSVPAPAELPDLHLLLDLAEAALPSLRKTRLLATAGRRPSTRKLHQIFWDTADLRLGRAGLAAGVQNHGRRRTQLAYPIAQPPTGGGVRSHSESPLGTDRPDPTRLGLLPGFDAALLEQVTTATLVPVFAIDLTRTQWRVRRQATELLVTFDTGTIEAARGRAPLRQLDLALCAGPAAGLYDFARDLQREMPWHLATHDLMQQGYRLAAGEDWWPPSAAGDVILRRSMSVRDGALAIGRAGVAAIRDEVARLGHGGLQPERIHQARVAIRRLRSMLAVFQDVLPTRTRVALAQDLGAFAGTLGHVREWDVFLANTLEPMIKAVGDEVPFANLRFAAAVLREEAADQALAALAAPDFMALSLTLGAWFDAGIWPEPPSPEAAALLASPLEDFAKRLLKKRHKKIAASVENLKDPHPGELHALRIEAKKLRYTAEFMRSLFPSRPFRRYLAGLKEIQLVLGTLNDAVVARRLVPKLALSDQAAGAHLTGLVTGWTAAEIVTATKHFGRAWAAFARTPQFWK